MLNSILTPTPLEHNIFTPINLFTYQMINPLCNILINPISELYKKIGFEPMNSNEFPH